ncbi:MAG: hypothetical protein LUE87_09285, partial [Lachnospiraceae bacterium]|nr:hypothetical protein [Lachnospiraceae bacterium]
IYSEENTPFVMDRAIVFEPGGGKPKPFEIAKSIQSLEALSCDIAIIACGEMVRPALEASALLSKNAVKAIVIDMYCVKPIDKEAVISAAKACKALITVEEHSPFGGLGSMVSQIVSACCPRKVINLALPDAPVITGTSREVFDYYCLNGEGIAKASLEALHE